MHIQVCLCYNRMLQGNENVKRHSVISFHIVDHDCQKHSFALASLWLDEYNRFRSLPY